LTPPLFPVLHSGMENGSACLCSDLQTEDYSPLYAWYNYILIIITLPTLSVFGVCTNIVNVFVYSRKRMMTSANTYLLFLACSDFLVILTGLFIFWIDSARSYIPELARAPYTTVYTLPFGYMAQSCSIYFTVAAAFDCYIKVCRKLAARSYCTVRRARQICFSVVIVSILYNSLRFPQFNLRRCFHEGSQEHIIEICPTSLFYAINLVYNVYMYMVLMTLLPFLFLLILNAVIVFRQSMNEKKEKANKITRVDSDLLESSSCLEEEGKAASGDDTITMIMVVVLFLACNTLALIVNVIETFFDPDPVLLNLLSDASNFLVIFNSSVNCVIYFIFNTEYRLVFQEYFHRVSTILVNEYLPCSNSRRPPSRPTLEYQPVSLHSKITRPSIIVNRANPFSSPSNSPVWQPLTSRCVTNLDWELSYLHDTTNGINGIKRDDDVDSGCSLQTRSNGGYATRWLAEVEIVERPEGERRPHIYVKALGEKDTISMTAL
ncbi:hypothetical protein PFISCL1PPCAC_2302, partial [Pristionchus fissidentatus]